MRLIYPVIALAGFLAISGCAHHNGAHQGGHGFAAKNYGLTYEQVREAAQDGDADAQYALGLELAVRDEEIEERSVLLGGAQAQVLP